MSKKKRVLDRRDQLFVSDLFDGRSFDDVLAELHSMAHRYEEEVFTHDKEVRFEIDHYGYDGGIELYVRVDRWETDREYDKRRAREDAAKEKARKARETKKARALATALSTEAEERELLARLQQKYGA